MGDVNPLPLLCRVEDCDGGPFRTAQGRGAHERKAHGIVGASRRDPDQEVKVRDGDGDETESGESTLVWWTVEEWQLLQAWCFLNDTTPEEYCADVMTDAMRMARKDPHVREVLELRARRLLNGNVSPVSDNGEGARHERKAT